MTSPSSEISYEQTAGFATTKGQDYETKLSALLFLRGINSSLNFQLATNVKKAGALDDVVFRVKSETGEWISYFVQLKHKENQVLKRKFLINPKGSFSLLKYFESYEAIKEAMSADEREVLFEGDIEHSYFVIFTNAIPNQVLLDELRCPETNDKFLGSNSGKVFIFDPNGESETEKAVLRTLQGHPNGGRDFLKRLHIFAGQPNEAELDNLIKTELQTAAGDLKYIDIDRLLLCFVKNVKDWLEAGTTILHGGSNLFASARDRVLTETCSLVEGNAKKMDLVFEEEALLALREVISGEFPVVHIRSSEQSSRLTCTKLLQTLEGSNYLFLGSESFLLNQNTVISEWGRGRHSTLIVSVDNRDLMTDLRHFKQIFKICQKAVCPKRSIVILTDDKIEIADDFKYLVDTFEFSSLKTLSRNKFLGTKLNLQACQISLQTLFADCCDEYAKVLSASSFVEIFEASPYLSIGSVLVDSDQNYLPRSLHRPQPNVLSTLFQVSSLPETCMIGNVSLKDIADMFICTNKSLSSELVHETLRNFSETFKHNQHKYAIFIGETFTLGKFSCHYLGASHEKVSALGIRPLFDILNCGWFVLVLQGTSFDDFTNLAKFHQAKHFLAQKGKLSYVKSIDGDDSFLREHFEKLKLENVMDIEERIVIIAGEPGMGKTTLIEHLAKITKHAYPHLWVILISLNYYTQLFAESKHENAVEFLLAAAAIKSPLEQSIFKLALEVTGNVVVMLDGYDEIAPKYTAHCCVLLSNLLKTKAKKIWVTTRITVKNELERHLSMTATRLSKFNEDDQRGFLKRYWSDARDSALEPGKEVLSDEELDYFISLILKITSQSISYWGNDFLGVPLHTLIIAGVFEDHVTSPSKSKTLPGKLDWLHLLDMFIEKKLGFYVQDKLKIKSSDTHYEMHLNSTRSMYLKCHMEAALYLILPGDYATELQSEHLIGDLSLVYEQIKANNTGFIDSIINGKAHFVHRVFAEYFVAKWFAANTIQFAKFVENYQEDLKVLRFLCDLILAKGCELHTAVLYGDVDRVKELLATGADVNARDLGGRTPLHLTAAFGHMDSTEARHVEILDLLIQSPDIDLEVTDEVVHGTPLRYADMTEYWLMIEKLLAFNVDTKCLTKTLQNCNSLNMIGYILTKDMDKLFKFVLDSNFERSLLRKGGLYDVNRILPAAGGEGCYRIFKLLVDRGYHTECRLPSYKTRQYPSLLSASERGRLEIVKLLVNDAKSVRIPPINLVTAESRPSDFKSLLNKGVGFLDNLWNVEPDYVNRKAVSGRTALHGAAEYGHVEIVRYLITNGAALASRDTEGFTSLHLAAGKKQSNVVKVLLDAVNQSDKQAFVNAQSVRKITPLHFAARAGFLEIVRMLVKAGGKMETDRYGQSPLMLAARNGHFDVVEYLAAALDEDGGGNGFRNTLSRTEWLNFKDEDGWTALNLAKSFGFQNVVELLTDRGADTRKQDGPDTDVPKDYEDDGRQADWSWCFQGYFPVSFSGWNTSVEWVGCLSRQCIPSLIIAKN